MTDVVADIPCPCGGRAVGVTGAEIYPHRTDLHDGRYFLCPACRRYVGAHSTTGAPLGTPADSGTRSARKQAHFAFDQLHRGGPFSSSTEAYAWLAQAMGRDDVRIGDLDERDAFRVVGISVGKSQAEWLKNRGVKT